ncbi:MAG: tetrahydromethanopterin S-methyltransferase subunit H [Candidatus Bathyarchaeia archaeon]
MFKFNTPQQIFEIGKVKVGGQPGELPTVLIASIFYEGQKIVKDGEKGEFDKKEAENLLNRLEQLKDLTGNPFMLDVVGTGEEAFKKYIDFVAEVTDTSFLLDAISPKLRLAAAQHVKEVGLQERAVYSSINKGSPKPELEKIKESGIKAAIILAENPADNSVNGKLVATEQAVTRAKEAGIEKFLIDTSIPAFGPDMGSAVRAIYYIKEKFGYPTGVGTGNVVTTCGWLKVNFPKEVRRCIDGATNAIMQTMGANWLMFGPIERSDYVFSMAAIADAYVLSATAELDIKPLVDTHPAFKVFM